MADSSTVPRYILVRENMPVRGLGVDNQRERLGTSQVWWVVPEKIHSPLGKEEISTIRMVGEEKIVSDNSKCVRTFKFRRI
jgi:hypothetical protein